MYVKNIVAFAQGIWKLNPKLNWRFTQMLIIEEGSPLISRVFAWGIQDNLL